MIRKFIRYAALASVVGLGVGACERAIATENETSGDTEKVIGTPNDAEALISTYYKRWHSGVYGTTTDLEGMANVMSMMNFSSLANNCQNSHFPFSGAQNVNAPGNTCKGEQYQLYQVLGEVDRVASNLLTQMDGGLKLGNTDPKTDARDLRARSFSEFLRGLSLGYVALMHDSGAVIAPGMSGTDPGKLVGYVEMMDSAYAALQRAIDYAQPAGVMRPTPVPDSRSRPPGIRGLHRRPPRSSFRSSSRIVPGSARTSPGRRPSGSRWTGPRSSPMRRAASRPMKT